MREREILIAELWRRLSEVSGVSYTARNPSVVPSIDNLPAISFFELDDKILKQDSRGGYPIYRRRLEVVIEPFINATSEQSASKELGAFTIEVKKKIYQGGITLGRTCASIYETETGALLRPDVGEHVIGISLAFEIIYIENIATII